MRTAACESADEISGPSGEGSVLGGTAATRSLRVWLLFGNLGIIVLVAAVFVAATARLFVFPSADRPARVDGIVSLNGSNEPTRRALAISLAEKGYAPVVLFSRGGEKADTPCPKAPTIAVVCFVDVPGNTRGEAEWAGQYAERHHWHSLMIVSGRAQVTRARLLAERCFSGRVLVVPIAESRPALSEVVHQWGGLLSALVVHRGC